MTTDKPDYRRDTSSREYKVQKSGRVDAVAFAGEEVVVEVEGCGIVKHGFEVRDPSGYVPVGKKYAGKTAKLTPLEDWKNDRR